MHRFHRFTRTRVLAATALAVIAVAATLVVANPSAQAAGPFQELNMPGVCNAASVAMAEAIDAKLKADGSTVRMLQVDQPKKGETGYVDGTVAYAMVALAKALKKDLSAITADDIANNPKEVKQAIEDALTFRKDDKKGDFTLTYVDKAGNNVYLWCLKATKDHTGPDLGLLYVPAGQKPADGLWIGACVLAGGYNKYGYSTDRAGNFDGFIWYNEGPDPDKKDGLIRYTYEYDPVKNILKITKEWGAYKDKVFTATKTEVEAKPGPAPKDFKGLQLNGTQISLLGGGCGCPAQTVLVAAVDPVAPQQLNLTNPPLGGDGSEGNPFVGISVTLLPGATTLIEAPAGLVIVGDGTNPLWSVVNVDGGVTALVRYEGPSALEVPIDAVYPDVALVAPAPPTTSPSPTSPDPTSSPGPTPTDQPTPTAPPTPSDPPTPTEPPTPITTSSTVQATVPVATVGRAPAIAADVH